MANPLIKQSKFLSYVLRHDPASIGLMLDAAGWADISALIACASVHGTQLDQATIQQIVATSDKQRFAIDETGTRIRANQGHSVPVELGLSPLMPPSQLFHGTASRFIESIRKTGLSRGARHHVHLSAEPTTATQVGGRHGKPCVLTIRSKAMHDAGYVFFRTENGVWLTDHVPAEFIEFAM